MPDTALDKFGQILIQKVRDEAITEWQKLLAGRMKGHWPAKVEKLLLSFRSLPADHKKVFLELVPGIVDTVLHYLLWTAEQQTDLQILITTDHGDESLREISDGLPGELYSDDGWIARFSNEARFL